MQLGQVLEDGLGLLGYSPREVDRIWGILGSYLFWLGIPYSIYVRGTVLRFEV